MSYRCSICQSFAELCGGKPTTEEPFHSDCYVHQFDVGQHQIRTAYDTGRLDERNGIANFIDELVHKSPPGVFDVKTKTLILDLARLIVNRDFVEDRPVE